MASETDILITFILDKSGSMGYLADSTIEGFNSYKNAQAEEDGNAYMSLVLFSTAFDVRYVAWNVEDIPDMGRTGKNPYQPSGGTALYDAVGVGVQGSEEWLKNNEWFIGKKLCVIWTDGQENSSHRWNISALNEVIDRKQKEGWIFSFVGSGGSAWTEARQFTAIANENFTNVFASAQSSAATYSGLNSSTSTLRRYGNYVAPKSDVQTTDTTC
jgi:hypothetical protein